MKPTLWKLDIPRGLPVLRTAIQVRGCRRHGRPVELGSAGWDCRLVV